MRFLINKDGPLVHVRIKYTCNIRFLNSLSQKYSKTACQRKKKRSKMKRTESSGFHNSHVWKTSAWNERGAIILLFEYRKNLLSLQSRRVWLLIYILEDHPITYMPIESGHWILKNNSVLRKFDRLFLIVKYHKYGNEFSRLYSWNIINPIYLIRWLWRSSSLSCGVIFSIQKCNTFSQPCDVKSWDAICMRYKVHAQDL